MKKFLPIIFTIGLFAFITLSFYVLSISSDAAKKRTELSLLKNREKQLPALTEDIYAKNEEIDFLTNAFPSKKDFVAVVSRIDSLAAAVGITVDFHFEREDVEKDENGDTIIPVTLTIQGEYANTMDFLKTLSTGSYFFAFKSIDGDSPDGLKGKNKIKVSANLYAAIQ